LARCEHVEELIEFDEGPLPGNWSGELHRRAVRCAGTSCATKRESVESLWGHWAERRIERALRGSGKRSRRFGASVSERISK
jgi:hypothetical protein